MKRKLLLFVALSVSVFCSGQTLQEAIDLLKVNKRDEATAIFKELQKSGSDKAEASLALAVTEIGDGHSAKAFRDFEVFFQNWPNPYPYVYALYNSGIFGIGNGYDDEVEQFCRRLLDDPKANPMIRSCAIDILGRNAIRTGDFKKANKIYEDLNDIKNWKTLGVFENVSASGFNKDFGVVANPSENKHFTNKNGAVVTWFDVKEVRPDHWMDMTCYHNISDAVIYSQTFIHSDEDKEVLLMIGVSGSLRVWLNDFIVLEAPDERNTDEDVYTCRVKLQKGDNRLLVQTGSSEINRNNFIVRLAGLDGNLLTGFISSANWVPYTPAQPYQVQHLPVFAETYFEQEVARQPADFLAQLMLLAVYNHNEKKYEAHKTLAALKKIAPLSTLVSEKVIEIAGIDDNVVDASKEREFIKTNDPESKLGCLLRANDAAIKENWEDAIGLLNNCSAKYGETPGNEIELISILGKKKDEIKIYAEVDKAYQRYPWNERIVEMKYLVLLSKTKDPKSARDVLVKYLNEYYSESILQLLAENFLKTGAVSDALKLMVNDATMNPYSAIRKAKLAQFFYERNSYNKALDWVIQASALCPYSGNYYYMAGLIFSGLGKKSDAIDMMRKCVYFAPTNYEAREKLRTLQDKKKLFDNFKQNDIVKLYNDALKNEKYAKEEAVILVNDERQIVYPEHGAGESQMEQLIYINSQTAIQQYKELNIPYNHFSQKLVIEKAELLKKDGNKVPAEKQRGEVVFSSLAVGDAVHLCYKLEDAYEGKLAEHFWKEVYFNNMYPVQTARYSLMMPVGKIAQYKIENIQLAPEQTIFDDYQMLVWEKADIPKIVPEPLMTDNAFDKLTISSIPDWNYVANWYGDITNIKTRADFEVKEKVKELMAGNENKTDIEKAKIIYEYIENNYNYSAVPFLHSAFVPQRASRTMSTRLGDCKDLSTLFVSMATEAGLNANLVLVRTKGSGDDNISLPSIEFNHCVAQLHAGGKNLLVELTNNYLPFSSMPVSLINATGLFIPRNGTSPDSTRTVKLITPDRVSNASVRNSWLSFSGADAVIHRDVQKTGFDASVIRYSMKDADNDDKVKKLTSTIVTEFNKNIKIENLGIDNLKNLDDSLHMTYDIKVDNFLSEIAGMQVFRIPWTDMHITDHVFTLDKRKYSLDLAYFMSSPVLKETITITLPAGKKIVEMPKDVTIGSPAFNYSVKYVLQKDQLIATRELSYIKDVILPDEYEQVKNAVAKINLADLKDIACK